MSKESKRIRTKPIAALWESYRKVVLPKEAHGTQIIETRRAFYAGAQALFHATLSKLEPGDEATDNDLAYMDDIDQELREFCELVRNGVA